jgi:prepilin-type N-terminal cleavage/methylation domain-containing protein
MDCKGERIVGIKGKKGVTLVELLVAAVIAAVLATIAFTIFFMFSSETKETAALTKLQIQYENVSEQMAIDTRRASRVVREMAEFTDPFSPLLPDTADSVVMCDTSGAAIARYRIGGGQLEEWKNGGWVGYNAGGGAVQVDPAASSFYLNNSRDNLTVNLRLKMVVKDSTYYLDTRKDVYVCRNQKLP